jgi:hypothetical protein
MIVELKEHSAELAKKLVTAYWEQTVVYVHGVSHGVLGRYSGTIDAITVRKCEHTCMDYDISSLDGYVDVLLDLYV